MKIEEKIEKDKILAPLTTFRIGGPAQFYVEIKEEAELVAALDWAEKRGIKWQILGGMSNVLISDNGYKGLIIRMNNNRIAVKGVRIEAETGVDFSQVVNLAIANNLSGLEWAAGVPGSIGGAVRGNAGAFGQSLADTIETVEVFIPDKHKFLLFSKKDCIFNYRDSRFKQDRNLLIWQVNLKLIKGDGQVIKNLAAKNLLYRQKTQPKLPSAGCVFRNVLIANLESDDSLLKLAKNAKVIKGGKIPTGWIINKLDLGGKKIGGAKISLEHNNFIVNSGKATAEEILQLLSFVKQQVKDKFDLNLQEEIELIGF